MGWWFIVYGGDGGDDCYCGRGCGCGWCGKCAAAA